MFTRPRRLLALFAGCLLATLAGCGGGQEPLPTEAPEQIQAPDKVIMAQGAFAAGTPFDSRVCAKPTVRQAYGVIVNPYFLIHAQTWRSFDLNRARLKNALNCLEAKRVYIQMRRADDLTSETFFKPGATYYESLMTNTVHAVADSVNADGTIAYREAFTSKPVDGFIRNYIDVRKLSSDLAADGFEVWAWLPLLNDPVTLAKVSGYAMLPPSSSSVEKMVSPANPAVQAEEKARVIDVVNHLKNAGLKGVAIDWYRYTQDLQPSDASAQTGYMNFLIAKGFIKNATGYSFATQQKNTALFQEYREKVLLDYLASLNAEIKKAAPNVHFGAFLMPHSAKATTTTNNTWSGINLQKITLLGQAMDIMPMVYPGLGWESGYSTWMAFASDVINRTQTWTKTTTNRHLPVLSITKTPQADLLTLTNQAKTSGTAGVVYFFPGDWLAPRASQVPTDIQTDSALQRLCRARGFAASTCNGNWPLQTGLAP